VSGSERETEEACAFDDIDHAAERRWTCLALRPIGGPGGATGRHVCHVEDKYRLVVRCRARARLG
jgi:hypothetical protein